MRQRFAATILTIILLNAIAVGAGPKRLTTDGRRKATPAFINAEELVYVDFEKPALTTLKRLKLSGLTVERLHPKAISQELEPAFSPDGRLCAYLKATGTLSVTLAIRDEQKNKESVLPPGGGFCGFRSPAFSPDGKRVVYSFAEAGYQDLFSINTQCKDRKQLTKNSGMNYSPSFSPDGKRILFVSTRDGNFEIYTMKVDGTDLCRLTNHRFQDLRPRYSPDGNRIAFTSNRDGKNFEVYVMNSDGTSLQQVTQHSERDDYPIWHPNGRQLVVISERDGRHDLYLVPVSDH